MKTEKIDQPFSGEFKERIYDIKDINKSQSWTWIKFTDNNLNETVGQFRGTFKEVKYSEKTNQITVLTSENLYKLDAVSLNIIKEKNYKYKSYGVRKKIRIPLIILFVISLFIFPKPKINQLELLENIELSSIPKLRTGYRGKKWIDLTIKEDKRIFKIDKHNFKQSNIDKILNNILIEDKITLGLRGSRVFYLSKNGHELTNLSKANEGRKQVQLWGLIFPFVIFLLTMIPEKLISKLDDSYMSIIIIIFILLILFLIQYVGYEHLF